MELLEESLDESFVLVHMTGMRQSKSAKCSIAIDKLYTSCYSMPTLCTAYKSTVQTEQAVAECHGVGSHE